MSARSPFRAAASLALLAGGWLILSAGAGSRVATALTVGAIGIAIPLWYVRHR